MFWPHYGCERVNHRNAKYLLTMRIVFDCQ